MDPETEFFKGLIELQYGKKVEQRLQKISDKVSWAKGWPERDESFWNAEAFMWSRKISPERRELIKKELKLLLGNKLLKEEKSKIKLNPNKLSNHRLFQEELSKQKLFHKELFRGKNLDLGCGAYSYILSTGLDFSEKMLQFNDNCKEKVRGDLEKELPLRDKQFNSVTAVFVLNYVRNYGLLLEEIKRVMKQKGTFITVLSGLEINPWQKQKEINSFSAERWKEILEKQSFKVKFYEKEGLWFFRCSLKSYR